jgi:23S rRNA (uracil1939-C5)-methyltransferase
MRVKFVDGDGIQMEDHSTDTFEIRTTSLVYGGDALGRLPDGRAVFVPFALHGELVRLRAVEEKRGHVRAELLEVLEPAPCRVVPRCPHYTVCGGCHYQHLDYPAQLVAKTGILAEQLRRIGGLTTVPIQPAVASPQPWNYRNQVQFHLTSDGRLGFQRAGSERVVPILECHLPEAVINQVWPQIDLEPLPSLERISLRAGTDGELLLVLESSDPQPVEFSVEELPVSAVHLGPGGALVLAGSESLLMDVLERSFRVSAASFFQVNTAQAAAMVTHVVQAVGTEPLNTVLDVYCGVGLFSAFLAPLARRLVGIEVSPSACEDFAANLDEFDHVELYEAEAEAVLTSVSFQPDLILVDPPRSGLDRAALDGLLAQDAARLIYISCDPATLGRDARRLVAGGYHLVQITPFDLFPQTYHIESVSIWQR